MNRTCAESRSHPSGDDRTYQEPAWIAWGVAAVLTVVAFAVRATTAEFTKFVCEDALITCRYAENLAAGLGFVYNPGEKVLGTSTPLYTLLLAAFRLLGVSSVPAAVWIGVLADSLVFLVVIGGLRRILAWPARIVFSGAYLLLPSGVVWVGSGMETGLYILTLAGALAAGAARREKTAFVLAAAATLIRPDGGLVFLALLARSLLDRRLPWKGAMAFGLTAGGWFLFSWFYFGALLPNSIQAKLAYYTGPGMGKSSPWKVADLMLFGLADPGVPKLRMVFHFLAAPLALAGIGFCIRNPRLRAIPIWVVLYLVFYLYAGMEFPWYFIPFQFGYLLLAGAGAGGVLGFSALLGRKGRWVRQGGALVLAGIALYFQGDSLFSGGQNPGWREIYAGRAAFLQGEYRQVAEFIKGFAVKGTPLYSGEIGYIGFYTGHPVLDSVGIVSPEVIPLNQAGNHAEVIRTFKPPIVVMSVTDVGKQFEREQWFQESHLPVDPRNHEKHYKRVYVRIESIPTAVRLPHLRDGMLQFVERMRKNR